MRQAHDGLSVQLTAATQLRDQLSAGLSDRTAEVGRLVRALDVATGEQATVKSQKEMLAVQLEEREKNFLLIKQQNDQLKNASETSAQREFALVRERDNLDRLLREKSAELQTTAAEKESLVQQQRTEADRTRSLEDSNRKLTSSSTDKQAELAAVEQVNASLTSELREAKYELSSVKDQVSSLQHLLEQREGNVGHELGLLTKKLQGRFTPFTVSD